jgi:hypothetical protein
MEMRDAEEVAAPGTVVFPREPSAEEKREA